VGQKGNGALQLGTVTEKMIYEDDTYQHTIGADYQESLHTDLIKGHRGSVTPDPHTQLPEVKPTLYTTQ